MIPAAATLLGGIIPAAATLLGVIIPTAASALSVRDNRKVLARPFAHLHRRRVFTGYGNLSVNEGNG